MVNSWIGVNGGVTPIDPSKPIDLDEKPIEDETEEEEDE
jgi:hypothetical protein